MKKPIYLPSIALALGIIFTGCKNEAEREDTVTEMDEVRTEETMEENAAYSAFNQYDANRDGLYDKTEFASTYESEFPNYDEDGDGSLNKEEFYVSTFTMVDMDQDDAISQEEWDRGNEGILNQRAADREISSFDTNGDEQITREEWNQGFESSDWFNSYDTNQDGLIQQEEWDNAFFDDWDLDNDGSLDEEEFNNFSSNNSDSLQSVDSLQIEEEVPQNDMK